MEVGGEGDYIPYRYTVTTRMTSALRWAVMRANRVVVVDRFYRALFSALKQADCALVAYVTPLNCRSISDPPNCGAAAALFGCYMAGTT